MKRVEKREMGSGAAQSFPICDGLRKSGLCGFRDQELRKAFSICDEPV
jgi:hypothetical protein